MPVDVQLATRMNTPAAAVIESWAVAALERVPPPAGRHEHPSAGDVCVRVVDEPEGRSLNHCYRGKDAATNVLSFPADVDLPDTRVWGDVVVCAPVVAREARAQDKPFDEHFAHMVVHGVLHLLGYDHISAADAAEMEPLEIRILDSLGVADPYGDT